MDPIEKWGYSSQHMLGNTRGYQFFWDSFDNPKKQRSGTLAKKRGLDDWMCPAGYLLDLQTIPFEIPADSYGMNF